MLESAYASFSSADNARGGLPSLLLGLFWEHLNLFSHGSRSVNGLVLCIAPPEVVLAALKTICTRTPPAWATLAQALLLSHHPYLTGAPSHSHPPAPTKITKNDNRATKQWRWLNLQHYAAHDARDADALGAPLLSALQAELLQGPNGLFAANVLTQLGARRCLQACLQARRIP